MSSHVDMTSHVELGVEETLMTFQTGIQSLVCCFKLEVRYSMFLVAF